MNDSTDLQRSELAIDRRIAELSPEKQALLKKRFSLTNDAPTGSTVQRVRPGAQDRRLSVAPNRITSVSRAGDLALSFAQQRLWLVDRILPDKASYNMPSAWRLRGPLDLSALQHGLNLLVARHETLRTHFAMTDAGPVQVITPAQAVALPLTDLSALEPEAREARARAIANAEAHQPFDLTKAPMLRAQLVRLAPEEHILLLNVHHIASDGWSVGVFERELSVAYAAFVKGHEPQLPALPIQYADYAIWQRQWLQGEVLQSQLSYWNDKLTGLSTLELPTDRPRPAVQSHRGAHLAFDLPAPLTEALKALGRRKGATLFMTLIAAFKVLLYRYSGQEDIAVGTPIAGRRQTELEGLIGFFVNTLVLRSDLTDNPSFRELLARVRETALGAYTHQDLPFEKLVEELAPARDLSRDPLFQVMFILQNAPGAAVSFDDVTISRLPLSRHTAKFDLTVSVRESEQGLRASWEYATDLFDQATIERMAGHFKQLLEAIVANPEQPIGELPILSAAERQQLLFEWNDTATDYPSDRCIHQLFEQQVARTPNAVAVVFEDQQLTYAELNARANQLAHHLITLGVGTEVLVGICLERSIELIIGLIAILKAGGAYVPLDPAYPRERLAFMLEDTQAPVLITAHKLLEQLPDYQGHLLCIDRDCTTVAKHPDTNPSTHTSSQSLAYVIYTSGSTGRPKGVAIPHRGVLRLVLNNDYVPFNGQQTFLLLSPISFDASTFELWGALLHGARCAIFNDQVPTIKTLGLALEQYQVRTLWLTASLFNLVVDEAPQILGEVRQLLTGGEALSPTHARAALKHLSNVQLINGYGPTENTTFTCCYRLPKVFDATWFSIPIGRPIANTQVYLLDRHFQPVPVGVTGELYIAGAGVARGYLNRPELTAEKFLPDPFSKVPGARMYRSGDLARYRPDGNIEFLGRVDDQVKIRGYRIELGEIETVLAEHPAVRQAVVLAREDTPGDKRLVAYVVPADPAALDVEPLRGFLRDRLPEYMRPTAYVLIKELPLTLNGKIDRKALPAPQYERDANAETFVAPRNALEELVAEVWREVLKLERVSIDDNFFDLGGHSLLAAQVVARLSQLTQVDIPLRNFFETPTVSAIGAEVERRLGVGEASKLTSIAKTSRAGDLALSFAQQRLWLVDRILPDKASYNMPSAWRLRGPLDLSALQHGLNLLVARHETLRTHFAMTDAGPVQVITPAQAVALPLTDLSALEPEAREAREARARAIANAEAHQPFDLTKAPMLRAQLVRLAPEEHILLLNVHHIASDGWSVGVFERELSVAYAAFVKGHEPQLPALPIQYADYAIWQRQWLQGEVLQSQLSYWNDKLTGLSTLELPTDRPRPAVQSHRGAHLAFDLPAPLTEALKALGRRKGATLFMTLIAAFKVLLYRYSGQEDIAVGTPIAGRRQTELEGLIGFFVNTLVLRSDLTDNPSFRELLARVRETALGAYTHQDLPFEKLVEELAPARDLSRDPLFQVMFILQNAPGAAVSFDDVTISRLPLSRHTAKFDLTVSVRESEQGLRASWEDATDLFDQATIERMAGHFKQLLEAIVANPEQPIGELPILSAAERQQLLFEWNDTATDYPSDRCIHQLFEQQVARTPNAVAVVFEDQQLTYAELNARANQLAHHLITLGVGTEVLVGICLERSIELIIGLIAILKAGGAYVPLDPAYPRERLAFMLEDTQAPVLITAHKLLEQLPDYQGHLLCIDRDCTTVAKHPDTNPSTHTSSQSLAYVIYTSGSTGRPKGVGGLHRSTVNRLSWTWKSTAYGPDEVFCQKTSPSFVDSVCEIFGPLLQGFPLVIVPGEYVKDVRRLVTLLSTQQVTRIVVVPTLLSVLMDTYDDLSNQFPKLTHWTTSGEALSLELLRRFKKRLPKSRLINLYGSSEVAADATCYDTAATMSDPNVLIGRPIANTQVYILDRHFQPVPVGVPGELYIGGAGLARGYLNRPELTAERFLPNPFSPVPGARMYRSGDRARYRLDGNIEFIGRVDEQVKIRGYRIELGEIETVLAEHRAVRQAVVLAREDTPGDKRLVAYVVPADPAALDVEPLRGFLRDRLPEYMRPAAYVLIKELPLTLNGKIDRKALPAPSQGSLGIPERYAAPRDQIERTLAMIWGQTLGIERVGIDDNFFEIGGHSLLAAKLFGRLDRALNRSLPLATLFESPTIRKLAVFYRNGENPANRSALVPIVPSGPLPPIFAVPGIGGNVLGFAELVRALGPEQSFFGLQSIGLDGNCEPLQTIEQMATEYIRELRQEQPCGPYYLMGACFGSAVAYEMAHQLLSSGEKVAFLGLIDPSLLTRTASTTRPLQMPSRLHRGIALARFVLGRIRLYREEMKLLRLSEQLQFLSYKTQLVGTAFQARDLFRGDRREFFQSRVTDTNLRAIQRHQHKQLGGGAMVVEIFASSPRFDRIAVHSSAEWKRLTGTTVMYHRMSGKDSGDMLRGDNAKKFAVLFRERLQRARAMLK